MTVGYSQYPSLTSSISQSICLAVQLKNRRTVPELEAHLTKECSVAENLFFSKRKDSEDRQLTSLRSRNFFVCTNFLNEFEWHCNDNSALFSYYLWSVLVLVKIVCYRLLSFGHHHCFTSLTIRVEFICRYQ